MTDVEGRGYRSCVIVTPPLFFRAERGKIRHGHHIGAESTVPLNGCYFVLTLYELVARPALLVKPCPCSMVIS
jgi:hypothetical protein